MKKMLFILILSIVSFTVIAQSAKKIDEILSQKALTKGHACYLVGTALEVISDTSSYEEAFDSFKELKMFKCSSFDEKNQIR